MGQMIGLLAELERSLSLPSQLGQLYNVSGCLLDALKDPARMATGTADDWPAELQATRARGSFPSLRSPDSDYAASILQVPI